MLFINTSFSGVLGKEKRIVDDWDAHSDVTIGNETIVLIRNNYSLHFEVNHHIVHTPVEYRHGEYRLRTRKGGKWEWKIGEQLSQRDTY